MLCFAGDVNDRHKTDVWLYHLALTTIQEEESERQLLELLKVGNADLPRNATNGIAGAVAGAFKHPRYEDALMFQIPPSLISTSFFQGKCVRDEAERIASKAVWMVWKCIELRWPEVRLCITAKFSFRVSINLRPNCCTGGREADHRRVQCQSDISPIRI